MRKNTPTDCGIRAATNRQVLNPYSWVEYIHMLGFTSFGHCGNDDVYQQKSGRHDTLDKLLYKSKIFFDIFDGCDGVDSNAIIKLADNNYWPPVR
jgi:hypothetical protein